MVARASSWPPRPAKRRQTPIRSRKQSKQWAKFSSGPRRSFCQPSERKRLPNHVTPQADQKSDHKSVSTRRSRRKMRTGFSCISASLHRRRGSAHPRRPSDASKRPRMVMAKKPKTLAPRGKSLRSQLWFDNPGQSRHDRALSRALSQLRPHRPGASLRQADHRHRADRLRPVALQPPSPRTGQARARRHPRRRRHRLRIPLPSDPGDRQAADRGARPQPRLSRAWSRCCTAIRSTAWC